MRSFFVCFIFLRLFAVAVARDVRVVGLNLKFLAEKARTVNEGEEIIARCKNHCIYNIYTNFVCTQNFVYL